MCTVYCGVDMCQLRHTDLGVVQCVQANAVSTECKIDRLEDELPGHGQFRDCSERVRSPLMGAIIPQRVRGSAQHENLHSRLVCHASTTPASLEDGWRCSVRRRDQDFPSHLFVLYLLSALLVALCLSRLITSGSAGVIELSN